MTLYLGFLFLVLLALVSASLDMSIIDYNAEHRSETEVRAMYESWLVTHGKNYNALGEKERRFEIFKDNLMFIDQHNRANRTYRVGLNQFADLTNEEYRAIYLGLNIEDQKTRLSSLNVSDRYTFRAGDELPDSVDWREKGAVPAVKNQGKCASCWAFAAVSAVEGINQVVTGNLITLSEQELVNCVTASPGCKPGYTNRAFEFIINNGGIDTAEDYPYTAKYGQCDLNKKNAHVVTIDKYEQVRRNSEMSLKKAVASQPVSVAIQAYGKEFQLYKSGVFTGNCGIRVDHAVVVVGYGTDVNDIDYWIVRNSWGAKWGEEGYIRMERNLKTSRYGKCGIAMWAYYPVKNGVNLPNPVLKVQR